MPKNEPADTVVVENNKHGPVDILVVEDNNSERLSIVAALEAAIPNVQVASVQNGREAADFLFAQGQYTGRTEELPPTLVLLDLAMPEANGFSVLGKIRQLGPDDALTLIPVVVFTDSGDVGDVKESYRCGANSYVMKPVSYPDFQTVVEKIGQYWMTTNKVSS